MTTKKRPMHPLIPVKRRETREGKEEKIKEIEKEMRFLFSLPMATMSNKIVIMYNDLEAKWKKLTNYEP